MESAVLNRHRAKPGHQSGQEPRTERNILRRANPGHTNPFRSTAKGKLRSPGLTHTPPVPPDGNTPPVQSGLRLSLPVLFLICGYVTGATLALAALLDLTIGVPFYRASVLFDLGLFVGSVILLYLSYDACDGA